MTVPNVERASGPQHSYDWLPTNGNVVPYEVGAARALRPYCCVGR